MNQTIKKSLVVLALCFLVVPMLLATNTVKANDSVLPSGDISLVKQGTTSSTWTVTTPATQPIKVDITISNAELDEETFTSGVWGWFMDVNWDPAKLKLINVVEGSYLNSNGGTYMIGTQSGLWDNVEGEILGGLMCSFSNSPPDFWPSDSGVLASLWFTPLANGPTTVSASNVQLYANSEEAQAKIGYEPYSLTNAAITMNIPLRTLTVNSAHGSSSPAVGAHSYVSGSSITASVTSPVIEGSTAWRCTGWTGTGSVPASGTTTTTTFTLTATAGSSITWNWVQIADVVNPQAVISASGNAFTNRALTLDGSNSIRGLDTLPSAEWCNITSYSWQVTLVDGTVLNFDNSRSITLTPQQVGSSTGPITAALTVTAPDGTSPTSPLYNSISTVTETFLVHSSLVTGTISAVEPISGLSNVTSDAIGSTINFDITVNGASNVWGWTTNVNWNTSVVELVAVTEGSYLSATGATFFVGSQSDLFDNVNGKVDGGISCAYQSDPQTSQSASGVLATLTFRIIGQGSTDIALTNAKLYAGAGDTGTVLPPGGGQLFVVPEYQLGALFALIAAFAGFIAFAATKKTLHFPAFGKRM